MLEMKRVLIPVLIALGVATCGSSGQTTAQSGAAAEAELAQWRERISAGDREIVALLNRRAEYVRKLAPLKQRLGMEVRDPGREDMVLRNIREANKGPLSDAALEDVYQAIMAAMRDLQARD